MSGRGRAASLVSHLCGGGGGRVPGWLVERPRAAAGVGGRRGGVLWGLVGVVVVAASVVAVVPVGVAGQSSAPAAPKGLVIFGVAGGVGLFWDDPGDSSITRYEYVAGAAPDTVSASTSWVAMANSGASTTSFTLTSSGLRYVKIRAVNGSGGGAASGVFSAVAQTAANTLTVSAAPAEVPEGNSGRVDVTVTVTLPSAAPQGGRSVRVDALVPSPGSDAVTGNDNYTQATSCSEPSPATADICWPNGTTFTIAEGGHVGNAGVQCAGRHDPGGQTGSVCDTREVRLRPDLHERRFSAVRRG